MNARRDVFSMPVNRLGLTLRGSVFEPLFRRLRREILGRGIVLRPRWYLSDGYGCVEGTCNVGLRWVEAIGQVPNLARRFGHLVRPVEEIHRTLRHEAGHAFCYVHRLYRLPGFRRLFELRGSFYRTYPDGDWKPDADARRRFRSGRYICLHCLKHPDEDFAITFQTWLDPASGWAERYGDRPALMEKFRYVEDLARQYGRRPYASDPSALDVPISQIDVIAADFLARAKIHRPGGGFCHS